MKKNKIDTIIDYAIARGFRFKNEAGNYDSVSVISFNEDKGRLSLVLRSEKKTVVYDSVQLLFFDMQFAKAIFGNEWEGELVQLSTAKNMIDYIYNSINKGDNDN